MKCSKWILQNIILALVFCVALAKDEDNEHSHSTCEVGMEKRLELKDKFIESQSRVNKVEKKLNEVRV